MSRGRGGGVTSRFGQWFVCGLCEFKRWVNEDDYRVLVTSAAVSSYLIAFAVAFLR